MYLQQKKNNNKTTIIIVFVVNTTNNAKNFHLNKYLLVGKKKTND